MDGREELLAIKTQTYDHTRMLSPSASIVERRMGLTQKLIEFGQVGCWLVAVTLASLALTACHSKEAADGYRPGQPSPEKTAVGAAQARAPQATPTPASPSTPATSTRPTTIATTPSLANTETPQMGTCHEGECSWARTLSRTIMPSGDGSMHRLTLLGGTSKDGDANQQHIVWKSAPHDVTITCSLTRPSVSTGDQTDNLELNAAGSDVPDVMMSSFILYAAECHPEAKNLDPDALAKRFNYQAPVDQ